MAENVQPTEGQGDEATGGLFDSYLQAVPEEHREAVTGYLKDAEKNVNSRLQQAAELEKQLGPYKDVQGLSEYPPELLSEVLGWHKQVTETPEAFQTWLAEAAKEAGLTAAEEQELGDAEEAGELSQTDIQRIIDERTQERMQPLEAQLTEWQNQQQIQGTETEIRDEFKRLETENNIQLSDKQKETALALGMDYQGEGSWVSHGFDRLKEITTEGQRAFVEGKAGQPNTPIPTGGSPAFKPTTDWGEASNQLRERLRNQQ